MDIFGILDPDPHETYADPKHCFWGKNVETYQVIIIIIIYIYTNFSQ